MLTAPLVGLLAACGQGAAVPSTVASSGAAKTSAASSAQAPAASSAATSAAATGPTAAPTVPTQRVAGQSGTLIRWQNRNNDAYRVAAQKLFETDYLAKHPGVRVQIESAPPDRDTKLLAGFAAGDAPDVFESWTDNVTQFADKGAVLDITPLVARDKVDVSDFHAWQWHDFQLPSGIRFGFPKYVNVMLLWYNKDMFQQKGVAFPTKDWTHDDYANAAEKLTVRQGNQLQTIGLRLRMSSWDRYWYRVEMWGGNVVDPNDNTKCLLDGQAAQDAFDWAYKLEYERKIALDNDTLGGLATVQGDRFAAGQWAMNEDGLYPASMATNIDTKFKWGYAHVPKGPVKRRVLGTTDGFVLWKDSKHQAEAWQVMQYLAGPEIQTMQVEVAGSMPVRVSVMNKWKDINIKQNPTLADVNLETAIEAMQEGYPGNRQLFKNDSKAGDLIKPALSDIFGNGKKQPSAFRELAGQVTAGQHS